MGTKLWIVVVTDIVDFLEPAFFINRSNGRNIFLVNILKTIQVQGTFLRHVTDGCFYAVVLAVAAVKDPCQYTAVVAVSRPHESTGQFFVSLVLAEPVNIENLWQLVCISFLTDVDPVLEVISHVVSTEG